MVTQRKCAGAGDHYGCCIQVPYVRVTYAGSAPRLVTILCWHCAAEEDDRGRLVSAVRLT